MALKTVVANELRKYGILSVQMQRALFIDQHAQRDVDAEPEAVDGANLAGLVTAQQDIAQPGATALAGDEKELVDAGLAPAKPTPRKSNGAQADLAKIVLEAGFTFDDYARLGRESGWQLNWDDAQSFDDIPDELAKTCVAGKRMVILQLQRMNKKPAGSLVP
jgi:hypothetical protein